MAHWLVFQHIENWQRCYEYEQEQPDSLGMIPCGQAQGWMERLDCFFTIAGFAGSTFALVTLTPSTAGASAIVAAAMFSIAPASVALACLR